MYIKLSERPLLLLDMFIPFYYTILHTLIESRVLEHAFINCLLLIFTSLRSFLSSLRTHTEALKIPSHQIMTKISKLLHFGKRHAAVELQLKIDVLSWS